jgi:hypothetical protein
MVLVVNLIGVGDDMLSIPIKAICKAPIRFTTKTISYVPSRLGLKRISIG